MLRQISAFSLMCTTIVLAVVTRVDILQHKERDQFVHLYSNGNITTNTAVKQRDLFVQHVQELTASAPSAPEQHLCVFVEDMLTPYHPLGQLKRFVRQCRASYMWHRHTFRKAFLAGLVEELRDHSIPKVNVEFRQCKLASLWGKVNITANEALDDLYQAIEELRNGVVPEEYKLLVQQELALFDQCIEAAEPFIDILRSDNHSLKVMIERAPSDHSAICHALELCGANPEWYVPEQRKEELIGFYLDLPLLGLRLFASIGQRPDTKHIIVCAGEIHITRLRSLLEQVGFTTVKVHYGTEELEGVIYPDKAVDLQKVVASSISH